MKHSESWDYSRSTMSRCRGTSPRSEFTFTLYFSFCLLKTSSPTVIAVRCSSGINWGDFELPSYFFTKSEAFEVHIPTFKVSKLSLVLHHLVFDKFSAPEFRFKHVLKLLSHQTIVWLVFFLASVCSSWVKVFCVIIILGQIFDFMVNMSAVVR